MSEDLAHAWTFLACDDEIWEAAYAWRSIKTFRMVVRRHQKVFESCSTTSLAALPQEIIAMIEANIRTNALDDAYQEVPDDECLCTWVWDEFLENEAARDAFTRSCSSHFQGAPIDPMSSELQQYIKIFKNTMEGSELWSLYTAPHVQSGFCEGFDAGTRFWESLSNFLDGGSPSDDFDEFDADLGRRLLVFLSDHHLQICEELIQEKEAENLFTLYFPGTVANRPKNASPLPFRYDLNKSIHRLKNIGLMSDDTALKWRLIEYDFWESDDEGI